MSIAFNGATKTITLSPGTTAIGVRDLWSRWVDWLLTGDNSKYPVAMSQTGGDDIDATAGTKIPVYAFLLNGWRIKPQEANHTLTVGDGVLLVQGGGDPFVNTTGSFIVRINYQQPVQAISFTAGGSSAGGLTTEQASMLEALAKIHGLISGIPLVVTATSREAGSLTQAIVEAGGAVTVTRTA